MDDLREAIKSRRKMLGWSQKDLADKAKCNYETIWALENNKRNVGIDTVLGVLDALGLEFKVKIKNDDHFESYATFEFSGRR